MDFYLPRYPLLVYFLLSLLHTVNSERIISNSQEIKDLFNIDPEFYPDSLLWSQSYISTTTKTFDCDGLTFYGSLGIFHDYLDYASTTYDTPLAHNVIYYTLTFSFGGTWVPTDGFTLYFSGQPVTWEVGATYSPTQCDFTDIKIKGKISHTAGTLVFKVQALSDAAGTMGFRKISIRLGNDTAPTAAEQLCFSSDTFQDYGWPVSSQCTCGTAYYDAGSVCEACDAACEECFGPGPGNCYTCNFGYYHNGVECTACTYNCTDCGTCGICSDLDYYMDNQCVPTCNLPFLAITSGDRRLCLSPCKDTEVIYADGSCQADCPAPLVQVQYYNKQVCSLPCPSSKTTIWDGTTYTCSSSPCTFPLQDVTYGDALKVCRYPCDIGTEIYYPDNSTCMSSCNFPYKLTMYGTIGVCQKPCPSTQYYQSWDLTCQNSCDPLFQKKYISGVWLCYPPQCGAQFCQTCGPAPTNQCQDYYFCNTTGHNARFCLPYYKYNLDIDPIRPVLNGVTLLVAVDPLLGIDPGYSDALNLSITGYHVQTDYTYTINKISTGTFQVEILIQRSVNSTGMNTSFHYGTGLTNYYVLPRITYIDETTQVAAQAVNKGSQIGFLLFAISIIGTVFSGGLSSIWTAMPESQYAYYLLYLNVDYLHQTELYFESLSSYDVLISNDDNPDQAPLDLSIRDILPYKFFILGYDPDFLNNTVQVFEQILAALSALALSALAIRYIRFSGRGIWILRGLRWIRNGFMWNMLIRQMLTYTLPLFISCFIEIYSAIFRRTAYFPSMLLAVLTILFFFVFFIKMLSLTNNIPKNKRDMVKYTRRYGTLWEDLDIRMGSKHYYWMVGIRAAVLAYLLVFLALYPYIQVILLILCQGWIVSLFLGKHGIRKVFEDELLNKVTMLQEVALLLTKIMILVYMVMTNHVGDEKLIFVGWLLILPGTVSQIVQTMYSTGIQIHDNITVLRTMLAILTKNKKRKLKKIRRINSRKIQASLKTRQTTISATDVELNSTSIVLR